MFVCVWVCVSIFSFELFVFFYCVLASMSIYNYVIWVLVSVLVCVCLWFDLSEFWWMNGANLRWAIWTGGYGMKTSCAIGRRWWCYFNRSLNATGRRSLSLRRRRHCWCLVCCTTHNTHTYIIYGFFFFLKSIIWIVFVFVWFAIHFRRDLDTFAHLIIKDA